MVLSLITGQLFVSQQEKRAIHSSADYSAVRMSLPTFSGGN